MANVEGKGYYYILNDISSMISPERNMMKNNVSYIQNMGKICQYLNMKL